MPAPKKYLRRGVEQRARSLACTARWLDDAKSVPNPNHVEAQAEIARMEAGLESWERFILAARAAGYVENSYPGKTAAGERLEAEQGFARKGERTLYTRDQVADLIGWQS